MGSNHAKIQEEKIKTYKKIILEILRKYELAESYVVLSGLELVGMENVCFWLQFVEYVKNTQGDLELENYVSLMNQVPRNDLLDFLKLSKQLSFEDAYLSFHNLLMQVVRVQSVGKAKLAK